MEEEVFLTRGQVLIWGHFKAYTFNKLRKTDPAFPKPLNFGERQLRWSLTELEAWAKGRKTEKPFLTQEKDSEDPNASEWIYLPGRTKSNEADRKTWVRKSGRTITVAVNGEISPEYKKSLEEFCAMHGSSLPENGERVSFSCLTAEKIAEYFIEKFSIREAIVLLQDKKFLKELGFTKGDIEAVREALNVVLSRAGSLAQGIY